MFENRSVSARKPTGFIIIPVFLSLVFPVMAHAADAVSSASGAGSGGTSSGGSGLSHSINLTHQDLDINHYINHYGDAITSASLTNITYLDQSIGLRTESLDFSFRSLSNFKKLWNEYVSVWVDDNGFHSNPSTFKLVDGESPGDNLRLVARRGDWTMRAGYEPESGSGLGLLTGSVETSGTRITKTSGEKAFQVDWITGTRSAKYFIYVPLRALVIDYSMPAAKGTLGLRFADHRFTPSDLLNTRLFKWGVSNTDALSIRWSNSDSDKPLAFEGVLHNGPRLIGALGLDSKRTLNEDRQLRLRALLMSKGYNPPFNTGGYNADGKISMTGTVEDVSGASDWVVNPTATVAWEPIGYVSNVGASWTWTGEAVSFSGSAYLLTNLTGARQSGNGIYARAQKSFGSTGNALVTFSRYFTAAPEYDYVLSSIQAGFSIGL